MPLNQSFKVRDFRNKNFFMVDDAYLNGYAKELGTTTSMVYLAICRNADKEQTAFPSQDYIAEKLGIHRKTVNRHIQKLVAWKIISVEKTRNHKGRFLHNTYYLLDKSEWKKLSMSHQSPTDIHVPPEFQSMSHQSGNKETYDKETYNISIYNEPAKISSLKGLTEENLLRIADLYSVPVSFVRSKYDDLINYCESKGKKYRNYLATLRHFVKQDALKIRKEALSGNIKSGIDARSV